jgi:hypothetical protein
MHPAAQAFRAACRHGVRLTLQGALVAWQAERSPPASLLAALASCKAELIDLLRADRCRWCGDRLAWPRPAGVIFADGTAECMPCADAEVERLWQAAERAVSSPDALSDPAEVMLRDESP